MATYRYGLEELFGKRRRPLSLILLLLLLLKD